MLKIKIFYKKIIIVVPKDFKIISIMAVFNEADIISPSIKYLIEQGIEVYVIDNWSTDGTYELAKKFEGKGLVGLERFPKDGPSKYFKLKDIVLHAEKISQKLKANWLIWQDCDEILKSPWKNLNLKEGIFIVDKSGYNAIDHTVIDFHPVDNNFETGTNYDDYFKYFEFGKKPGHFGQIKTWKKLDELISLHSHGHQVLFKSRKVYPYKFLLKHYPIRSQKHGEKKIFLERISRWYKPERARGWHAHYEDIRKGHNFLHFPEKLKYFDDKFYKKYLIELISGIGIINVLKK